MRPPSVLGKTGFMLSGGGLQGGVQFAFIESLLSHGITPSYVFDVSVGSINGATLVADKMSHGVRKWSHIDKVGAAGLGLPEGLHGLLPKRWLNSSGLSDGKALYGLLDGLDPMLLIDSPIKFEVMARNITSGHHEIFSNHDPRFNPRRGGDPNLFIDVIVASSSLPPFFPPVRIWESFYADGSFCKLKRAFSHERCETVFALKCNPPGKVVQEPQDGKLLFLKTHFEWAWHIYVESAISREELNRQETKRALHYVALLRQQRQPGGLGRIAEALERKLSIAAQSLRLPFGECPDQPGSLLGDPPRLLVVEPQKLPPTYQSMDIQPGDIKSGMALCREQMDAYLEKLLA